jgi:hypothetical protein
MPNEDDSTNKSRWISIENVNSLFRTLIFGGVFVVILFNLPFFLSWLNTVQHLKIFGQELDRNVAEAASQLISNKKDLSQGDPKILKNTVAAAGVLAPALQGAKILWIDNNFGNNYYERQLVESMGVHIQVAWSEEEALSYLDGTKDTPDLVITNVSDSKIHRHLTLCPAMYSSFPPSEDKGAYADDIWAYNRSIQDNPQFGLAITEAIAERRKDQYANHQQPRVIFYSSSKADILSGSCVIATTNRYDVLLQAIVAALGTFRGKELVGYTLSRPGAGSSVSVEFVEPNKMHILSMPESTDGR